ncbi:T9SS type A sorting domain-containing protein [Candidatus Aerophobetes bacterium]|uniref:T9SS type A sorting domain-containing protein n=1 Tax=Aerophobetes bacterium TaxID=2030807 RepID=A0A523QJ11_UNCAE|nr:MAG: T9SS type A sorting domain-containing protein [Candidatus Aerophobetes bacterium]
MVYPNPFEAAAGHSYVTFEALTEEVTIQIFTVSGQLVRKEEISGQYSWDWDLKNTDGEKVARGVYIWMATNPAAGEKRTGKIAVIQ